MLETNYRSNTTSFSNSCDKYLLGDLSCDQILADLSSDEASVIIAGFNVKNSLTGQKSFYTLSVTQPPTQHLLNSQQSGSYTGSHILYNSSLSTYKPVLQSIDDQNGSYSFTQDQDNVRFAGINLFKAST
ncbi:hypothetical protein BLD44_010025 [Mastigocladus laminosus UU774]|nr:hypothetical protein B4U84_20420 [Westiellopsis prolifica IICB1]TFI54584.1 hypothetical protein BLD44_010025 [Mastigocladus laminosus UU774]